MASATMIVFEVPSPMARAGAAPAQTPAIARAAPIEARRRVSMFMARRYVRAGTRTMGDSPVFDLTGEAANLDTINGGLPGSPHAGSSGSSSRRGVDRLRGAGAGVRLRQGLGLRGDRRQPLQR